MGLLSIFNPAPHAEPIQDKEEIKKRYKYWRIRTFYSMYIGYIFFYISRKSFTFAMPSMIQDLGMTKAQLGILGSVLAISYGMSKFVSGVLSDRSNPRYIMSIGLILTGVFNIFFGGVSSLLFFVIFWGLNGWFQGWGWPPCARLLTHWYSQKERGTWWGFWNSSHNIGGFLIPLIAAYAAQHWGWRFAMYIPGGLCILAGLFLLNRLRDTPQSLGLPRVEDFKDDHPPIEKKQDQEKELSTKEILFKYILKNKVIWVLAIAYFFVYIVRNGINDWSMVYFVEAKGYTPMKAGFSVSFFEIGGVFGSLAAGWLSDKIFSGRRGQTNVLFGIGVIFALYALWNFSGVSLAVDTALMFAIGFLIFGPQMLIGMAAAELSHKKAAGSATGFVGWIAYLGAAAAGYPIGRVSEDFGWQGVFWAFLGCGIIALCCLLPLWSAGTGTKKPVVVKQTDEEPSDDDEAVSEV